MGKAWFAAILGLWLSGPVLAAEAAAPPASTDCATRTDVLGVSRIVEVDTTGGPLLGNDQYRELDFLKDGEVVLTFDDGPLRRHTLAVLEALDAACTKATFFSVGQMALADPAAIQEVARRGHTVGTHTWSHRNLRGVGAAAAEREFELGVSAVSKAIGAPVAPFFRFPYLSDSRPMIAHLAQRGFAVLSIDIDTKDYRTRNAAAVKQRVLSALAVQKKGIILFHDIQASTAGAIKGLLDELYARGFKVVHLVPKQPATTLPAYDEIAQKEFDRRTLQALSPIAARSVVWPIATGTPSVELTKPAQLETGPAAKPGEPSVEETSQHSRRSARRRAAASASDARKKQADWTLQPFGP